MTTKYNLKQQQVIDAVEPFTMVIAPAGSGKTSTLVGTIQKHIQQHPDDHITAITFTRKAAMELITRINDTRIETSTIHSWAYRRLNDLGGEYGFKVQLLQEETIKEILIKLCRLRHHYHINIFQLYSYAMGNYNIDVDDSIKKTFEKIRRDYIAYKRKNTLYDFTDLPEYLLDKLKEYEQDIKDIDALFVDEFQDIDPIQLELFNLVKSKRKMYIGDPCQSIYQFRGSMDNIMDNMTGFKTYDLNINYRSYQEIIDYATTARTQGVDILCEGDIYDFTGTDFIESSNIECENGNGGMVYLINRLGTCINLTNDKQMGDITTIKSLIADKNTQLLCRSNKQVKKMQALGIENVSTIHQAKGLEYDNVIITDFPIDCDEELNVMYVGMTRARKKLCVCRFDILAFILCQQGVQDIIPTNKLF